MDVIYLRQTELLLRALPIINKVGVFGLHGGTALNLFHDELPRLSVDIDLTYLPIVDRDNDLNDIKSKLKQISTQLRTGIPGIQVSNPNHNMGEYKLFCSLNGVQIKIEVNTINRGVIEEVDIMPLCLTAQENHNQFFEMSVVSKKQLYGGKIVAALDRQHPRDIFDTMRMLDREQLNDEIIIGFLFCLLSSSKPIHEILTPIFKDQESALNTQFKGMTDFDFTYSQFQFERTRLLNSVFSLLTESHKYFLKCFAENKPDWIFGDWSIFPGIKWKLKNLKTLEKSNKIKFQEQIDSISNIDFGHT